MTLQNPTNVKTYTGNGVTTVFPYDFLIPGDTTTDQSNVEVTLLTIATGVEGAPLADNLWSITGVGEVTYGNVTYTGGGTPLPSTHKINIRRVVPYEQTLDLTIQSSYFPELLEETLDRIVMQIQQLAEESERAVKATLGSSQTPQEFIDNLLEASTEAAASAAAAAASAVDAENAAAGAAAAAVAAVQDDLDDEVAAAAASAAAALLSENAAEAAQTAAEAAQAAAEAAAIAAEGLPAGGTTGQVLAKTSATDYDADWTDPATSGESQTNALFYELANLKGSIIYFPNGIADAYDSETNVDTATSTNESYDAANDLYAPTTSGGNDSFTKVLLHFDGSDGSTTITDVNAGGSAHTWTASGNAQLDTGISPKFGTAALLLDGAGDWVRTPDSADWNFGSSAFTIDTWFYFSGSAGTSAFLAGQGDAAAGNIAWYITHTTGNKMQFNITPDGATPTAVTGTTNITTTGWHHIEVVRTGNTLKLFLNGVQEGGDVTFSSAVFNSASALGVGSLGDFASSPWNGLIDEFRISAGVARHTSNFTPPTTAYTTPVTDNMTLVSNAFTATAVPTVARIAAFIDPQVSMTINTDFTAEASRDGGTTWTAITLALVSNPVGTVEQYEGTVPISAQPSGSSMKYRLKTLNNKDIDVTGIVFGFE